MQLTYLDNNSWCIDLGESRILLDPWLVDDLVFGNLAWLFKGIRRVPKSIPDKVDLILLSQGLEDHAHPQTLKKLDRKIPVVGSPNAIKVVQNFNYDRMTALEHGECFTLNHHVEITAVPGSPIGPFLVENGYVIKDKKTGTSLYYEPHGYHSPQLKELMPIDVIITPFITISLPLLGCVIQGKETAIEVARSLQPQVMLPTAAGGDVDFNGVLATILRSRGSLEEFQQLLEKYNLETRIIDPKPGERYKIPLQPRAMNAV
ncbi:MAG: MBL fold metallo-hydrolase [Cyanobacteria bacterium P01_E01_bin.42]